MFCMMLRECVFEGVGRGTKNTLMDVFVEGCKATRIGAQCDGVFPSHASFSAKSSPELFTQTSTTVNNVGVLKRFLLKGI